MQRNHLNFLLRSIFIDIKLRTGFAVFLAAIFLQCTTGCNPGSTSLSPIPPYTISQTTAVMTTHTISPTKFPTDTPTLSPTSTPDYSRTIDNTVTLRYDIGVEENSKSFLDLDTMETGDTPQSDLHFAVTRGSMEWVLLGAINGAQKKERGYIKITLEDCFKEPDLDTPAEPDAFIGNHLCIVSNKNRLFLIFIEDIIVKLNYASIDLLITTYI